MPKSTFSFKQDDLHRMVQRKSLRGQDIKGADFSGVDIRGVDFTDALLHNANFKQAKAGLSFRQSLGLTGIVFLFFVLAGFIAGYSTGGIGSLLMGVATGSKYASQSGGIALAILAIFFVITLRKGLALSGMAAVTLAAIAAMLAAFATVSVGVVTVVQSLTIAGAVAGVLYCAVATAATLAFAHSKVLFGACPITLLMAGLGILFAVPDIEESQLLITACAIALLLSLILIVLGTYAGRLAWQGDPKYELIRQIAIALTARGTCFHGADLTDADFSGASLGNTDFREARLLRTNWHKAQELERADREGTYLANDSICRLVVTKDGHDQVFDRQDLRGLNLEGANLADANLMKADLGAANLKGADLSRSQLVQTQLHETDLTGVCLTGAYIQDWGISTSTRLEQVQCDYIYMQLPTKDDPDPCRKPDNRNEVFKENDFSDFMAPIIKTLDLYRQQHVDPREVAQTYKTLDLYHHEGIDPQAAAIALKALADQHPDANLQVVALEGRGQERIRLQAQVLGNIDRSELSAEYFEQYSRLKALPYGDIQALLAGMAEKDERIRSLETIGANAIQSDRFYVETYYQLGDTVAEKNAPNISSGGGDVNFVGGDVRDVSGVVSLGQISGAVSNTINQLPDAAISEGSTLKELLSQLQITIESAVELPAEDKAEALEQVKTLAEVGQEPEAPPDGPLKKAAKTAMKILKGTAAGLPDATKLVEEFNQLLPAIATLIGLL